MTGADTPGLYSDEELELADDLAYSLTVDDYDAIERDGFRAEYRTDKRALQSNLELVIVYPAGGGSPPVRYDRECLEKAGSAHDVRRARREA